ncbi:MAG: STAS domain-containing protein [Calditrichae bacterium]|nr:STAS domain-containing protein [Calditrichia bacterium]
MENIKINSKFADKNGEIMVVELGGHVDQSNSYQLQKMFDDIIDSGVFKVVVDFKELHYMSSAGWGIFVGEVKRFRDNGGDIKLASMTPEINDVYQMLEFYHILDDFSDVQEASESFGLDGDVLDVMNDEEEHDFSNIESSESNGEAEAEEIDLADNEDSKKETAEVIEMIPSSQKKTKSKNRNDEFIPNIIKTDLKLAELPLTEKIKRVVSENPLINIWQVKKVLNHEHFGNTDIGIFKLYKLLKDLDLNTKEKRYRYYRSC